MIGRSLRRDDPENDIESKGFDAFELRLGDVMRGERATMGKSLLDVQRELKIKAAYIAAIENSDPTAFDTPGFIAGYVRSYARYLNMDPDWAFETFCRESGFATAHGMSEAASSVKPIRKERPAPRNDADMFSAPATPFIPAGDAFFSRIEPGAVGSVVVLLALIGGLGYGGWTVLQEVQKVQFAPVEQTPTVVADIDPLSRGGAAPSATGEGDGEDRQTAGFAAPSVEALDRLYRPQALDRPVMVARDAPISTLDPRAMGALVPDVDRRSLALADAEAAPRVPRTSGSNAVEDAVQQALGGAAGTAADTPAEIAGLGGLPGVDGLPPSGVQVTEDPAPAVQLVAVRPAWVRVRSSDGTVIYEAIMNSGDTFTVPQTEDPATLRIGESGAVYFAVNGTHYGPVGPNGQVTSNVALSAQSLTEAYAVADISGDDDLAKVVNVAEAETTTAD